MMRTRKRRSVGSAFDSFLKDQGRYEDTRSQAVKEVNVWQIAEQMKQLGISKVKMAEMIKISRSQLVNLTDYSTR